MGKEPYTQEKAAELLGQTTEIIRRLITSPGPHDQPLTPYIFIDEVDEVKASSVRQGKEVTLKGFYEIEGIERMPQNCKGDYVLSFTYPIGGKLGGPASRLLLHKDGDTFFLHGSITRSKEELFVSAEEVNEQVSEIERHTPPKPELPRNKIKEYIKTRLSEGADKAEIAAKLKDSEKITHWGLQTSNSPRQWRNQEEAAKWLQTSPENLFKEGYLLFPLVYFKEPVQMRYIYQHKNQEMNGIWFDSVDDRFEGFFAIGNFHDLDAPVDGFYQIGNRKACLWQDPSDNDGWYVIEEPMSVHKSELLVSAWEIEYYLELHGRTGKVGLPDHVDKDNGSEAVSVSDNIHVDQLPHFVPKENIDLAGHGAKFIGHGKGFDPLSDLVYKIQKQQYVSNNSFLNNNQLATYLNRNKEKNSEINRVVKTVDFRKKEIHVHFKAESVKFSALQYRQTEIRKRIKEECQAESKVKA